MSGITAWDLVHFQDYIFFNILLKHYMVFAIKKWNIKIMEDTDEIEFQEGNKNFGWIDW